MKYKLIFPDGQEFDAEDEETILHKLNDLSDKDPNTLYNLFIEPDEDKGVERYVGNPRALILIIESLNSSEEE